MTITSSNYVADVQNIIVEVGKNITHKRYTTTTYDATKAYQNPTSIASLVVNETVKVLWGQLSDVFNIMLQGAYDANTTIITVSPTTSLLTDDIIIDDTGTKYRIDTVKDINLSGTKIAIEAGLRKYGT